MEKGALVYKGFSFKEFFGFLISRLAAVVGSVSALLHFDENPVVISLFVAGCLLMILFLGDDQVNVYQNVIVHKTNSIAAYLFNFKTHNYLLSEIDQSFFDLSVPDTYSSAVMNAVSFLSKKSYEEGIQPIFLKMKDGNMKQLLTRLDYQKRMRIVEEVNQLLKNLVNSAEVKKKRVKKEAR